MSATATTSSGTPETTPAHRRLVERAQERDEPTQTRTLRKRYAQRLRGRWDAIMAAIRKGIVEFDALGLQTDAFSSSQWSEARDHCQQYLVHDEYVHWSDALVDIWGTGDTQVEVLVDAPRDFTFDRESDQVQAFDRWLQRQTDREILQTFGQDNQFVRSSYERGIEDANRELRALGLTQGDGAAATALRLPVHREQVQALYTRNFNALQGMTDATANQTRRVLSEGLASGEGPREIARDLADRVDHVGKHRATLIGRTEILHSHNRARATEWQRSGVKRVDILIAADACPECQALKAGAPYSVDEAPGLLPLHPQCKCALSIHTRS